ncbi:MAG: M20/M25/M40 family metallo-hydrolase, partial [Erysipelotrichaceae bacterium]|nr:M20/M25/M40 family metallo-hydrolase [Erysipelotrichaceae bacterium]
MKTLIMIICALFALIVFLLVIAIIRTMMLKQKSSVYKGSSDKDRIDEYAGKLQKMVQVPTVSVAGKPDPELFRRLHKVMEEEFPEVFKTCEKIDLDGSLLVRWRGRNPDKQPIVLTSHLDVVAAEGDWTHPPFEGKIVEGKMYGRGFFDVKCGVMSFYQAVEELIKEGYVPDCDV